MKYGILNIKWSQVHVFNSSTLEADLFELEASLVYILNSRTVENYIVKPYLKKVAGIKGVRHYCLAKINKY